MRASTYGKYVRSGLILKAARIRANITQRELSKITGIKLCTLQSYEQGRTLPTTRVIFRLLDAVSCSASEYASALTRDMEIDAARPEPVNA